jgi:WXG100 family type VII secretion target
MNDDVLVVNFAALSQASSDIQVAVTTMADQLHALETDAAPLVAQWAGEAQAAYYERQQSWRSAAADLTTMLGRIKQSLDESAADYQATEHSNASLFQR